MISNTKALNVLRTQIQEVYDFAVLNCYSVPSLKMRMKDIEKGIEGIRLPNPDYFKGSITLDELRNKAQNYKTNLCKYVLLSSFSFFESYVISAINEMIDFHGGRDDFLKLSQLKTSQFINNSSRQLTIYKRKLQEYFKSGKKEKYNKYYQLLEKDNYRFPTQLLSPYGVKKLIEVLDTIRSVDIPDVLAYGLNMNLGEATTEQFHNIRNIRNMIAHGDTVKLDLKKVGSYNKFLRDLSIKIDKHLVEHFFVIEI